MFQCVWPQLDQTHQSASTTQKHLHIQYLHVYIVNIHGHMLVTGLRGKVILSHTRYRPSTCLQPFSTVIICTHAHSYPQVATATHQCMLNHTWGRRSPPLTLVGGCYKQSWAPFLASLPPFPPGKPTVPSCSVYLAFFLNPMYSCLSSLFIFSCLITSHCLSLSLSLSSPLLLSHPFFFNCSPVAFSHLLGGKVIKAKLNNNMRNEAGTHCRV